MKCVYFISNGVHIKIGKTTDIKRRMSELQVGSPLSLKLLGYVPDEEVESDWFEKFTHDEFKQSRVLGEWFHVPENEVLLYIGDYCGEILVPWSWDQYKKVVNNGTRKEL